MSDWPWDITHQALLVLASVNEHQTLMNLLQTP